MEGKRRITRKVLESLEREKEFGCGGRKKKKEVLNKKKPQSPCLVKNR
jgi:hypothetical protein